MATLAMKTDNGDIIKLFINNTDLSIKQYQLSTISTAQLKMLLNISRSVINTIEKEFDRRYTEEQFKGYV